MIDLWQYVNQYQQQKNEKSIKILVPHENPPLEDFSVEPLGLLIYRLLEPEIEGGKMI